MKGVQKEQVYEQVKGKRPAMGLTFCTDLDPFSCSVTDPLQPKSLLFEFWAKKKFERRNA